MRSSIEVSAAARVVRATNATSLSILQDTVLDIVQAREGAPFFFLGEEAGSSAEEAGRM
jgi:hypothetical protein